MNIISVAAMAVVLQGPGAPVVSAPAGRSCAAAAYSPSLGVLVAGGGRACGRDILTDPNLWAWDGSTWRVVGQLPAGVDKRDDQLLAVDDRDGSVIVYGGRRDGRAFDDLWLWRGGAWHEVPSEVRPPAVEHAAAAFDQARGRFVLFGGATRAGVKGETWEWTETGGWSRTETPLAPAARLGHSMAWSPAHGGVLLYGGFAGDGHFRDTWLWKDAAWTRLGSAGPSVTEGPALVAGAATVYLTGPGDAPGANATFKVWELGPAGWRAAASGPGPALTVGAAVAFDRKRGALVLFSGYDQRTQMTGADVWEFDGRGWTLSPSRTAR